MKRGTGISNGARRRMEKLPPLPSAEAVLANPETPCTRCGEPELVVRKVWRHNGRRGLDVRCKFCIRIRNYGQSPKVRATKSLHNWFAGLPSPKGDLRASQRARASARQARVSRVGVR